VEACGDLNNPGTSFMGYDKVGAGVLNVTDDFVSKESAGSTAGFSITLLMNVDALLVFIKQSGLAGFFELSGPASAGTVIAGSWFIDGPGNPGTTQKKNEFSHRDFYYTPGTVPPPSVIPLPAAGWLLLAGIGGLVGLRRRRKA
jgi:hypothetical protein